MIRTTALAATALVLATAAAIGWQRPTTRAAAPPASSSVDAGDGSVDGAVVFRVKGCAACHVRAGSKPLLAGFPDLTHAADWAGTRRSGMSAEAYVRESIREPNAFISPAFPQGGPTPMPVLALADREVDALVALLLHGE